MRVLYICTHNRCRSILSEALTNFYGEGLIEARSAGSQPSGEVHPLSVKYLDELGVTTAGLASKSWDELEDYDPDLVITLCDSAASETCPLWMGPSAKCHWPLTDPSKVTGTNEEKKAAFLSCIEQIRKRVDWLADQVRNDTAIGTIKDEIIKSSEFNGVL